MNKTKSTTDRDRPKRLLKVNAVSDITSIERSQIFRMAAAGTFPRPLRLSEKRVAWIESEVLGWIESRERVTYDGHRVI